MRAGQAEKKLPISRLKWHKKRQDPLPKNRRLIRQRNPKQQQNPLNSILPRGRNPAVSRRHNRLLRRLSNNPNSIHNRPLSHPLLQRRVRQGRLQPRLRPLRPILSRRLFGCLPRLEIPLSHQRVPLRGCLAQRLQLPDPAVVAVEILDRV